MKSKSLMKPTSLLIACCATTALAFLIGVVDNSYAARGGRGGGFSRGGAASSGSFSSGPAGAGRAGVGGQAGVGGGPASPAGVGDARVGNVAGSYVVLPYSANAITVDGVTYYTCGSTYYTQSYSGGSVVYVESAPPPGY